MTPADLLAFEERIAKAFAAGKIKAPIHLSRGNEDQLIKMFRDIKPDDYVLCGWRSHFHCLLKGVPPADLERAILDGRSVSLCFAEHKILCSGIVGGIAPIAVGLAWAIKKKNDADYTGHEQTVWVFLGDMSYESGVVHESIKYAAGHELPVKWIVEDNGKSVCTDTRKSWGESRKPPEVECYTYDLTRPHAGIGVYVRF